MKRDDVSLFLFHQANLRINEFVANALEIPASKVRNNIDRYGNCSAASIPILLAEAEQRRRAPARRPGGAHRLRLRLQLGQRGGALVAVPQRVGEARSRRNASSSTI